MIPSGSSSPFTHTHTLSLDTSSEALSIANSRLTYRFIPREEAQSCATMASPSRRTDPPCWMRLVALADELEREFTDTLRLLAGGPHGPDLPMMEEGVQQTRRLVQAVWNLSELRDASEREQQDLRQRIEQLRNTETDAQRSNAALREQCTVLERQLHDHRSRRHAAVEEIEKLNQELENVATQLYERRRALSDLNVRAEDIRSLEERVKQGQIQLEQHTQQLKAQEKVAQSERRKLDSDKTEHMRRTESLRQLETSLQSSELQGLLNAERGNSQTLRTEIEKLKSAFKSVRELDTADQVDRTGIQVPRLSSATSQSELRPNTRRKEEALTMIEEGSKTQQAGPSHREADSEVEETIFVSQTHHVIHGDPVTSDQQQNSRSFDSRIDSFDTESEGDIALVRHVSAQTSSPLMPTRREQAVQRVCGGEQIALYLQQPEHVSTTEQDGLIEKRALPTDNKLCAELAKRQQQNVLRYVRAAKRSERRANTTMLKQKSRKPRQTVRNKSREDTAELMTMFQDTMSKQNDMLEELTKSLYDTTRMQSQQLTETRDRILAETRDRIHDVDVRFIRGVSELRDRLESGEKERSSLQDTVRRMQLNMTAVGSVYSMQYPALRQGRDSQTVSRRPARVSPELGLASTIEEFDELDDDRQDTGSNESRYLARRSEVSTVGSSRGRLRFGMMNDWEGHTARGIGEVRAASIAESSQQGDNDDLILGLTRRPLSLLGKRKRSALDNSEDVHGRELRLDSENLDEQPDADEARIHRSRPKAEPTNGSADIKRQILSTDQPSPLEIEVNALADNREIEEPYQGLTTMVKGSLTNKMLSWAQKHEHGQRYCLRMKANRQGRVLAGDEVEYACSACERRKACCFRLVRRGVLTMVPLRDAVRRGGKTETTYWRLE